MAIHLPERTQSSTEALTPRQIVAELDKHVIGQHKAKRAVAIALRNRMRRQKLPKELAEDVAPKNILMIGPTGVGKTEIARRLARLAQSPFIKVEASKFTEVGYVGRDVESMVRDLVELSITMVRDERYEELRPQARQAAEDRLLDLLLPPGPRPEVDPAVSGMPDPAQSTRERLREQLRLGRLDHRAVEIDVRDTSGPAFEIISGGNVEEVGINVKDMMPGLFQGRTKRRKLLVPEAFEHLTAEELSKLADMESVSRTALERVEQSGIIFIDEIDKIAGPRRRARARCEPRRRPARHPAHRRGHDGEHQARHGEDRSHPVHRGRGLSCVQAVGPDTGTPRPLPDPRRARGAGRHDFVRILTEPKSALVKQYVALLATEGVEIAFTEDAIERVAALAAEVNEKTENIGARRLHTVMERLLDEISFDAPDRFGASVTIDEAYVNRMLAEVVANDDLSRYIL